MTHPDARLAAVAHVRDKVAEALNRKPLVARGDRVSYTYIAVPDDETLVGEILWMTPGGSEARVLITTGTQQYRAGDTVQLPTSRLMLELPAEPDDLEAKLGY